MTVSRLQQQLKSLTAHGRKLSADDVRKLVATAKDGGKVGAEELNFLNSLKPSLFTAGAKDDLATLLGGIKAQAYVDVSAPQQTELGKASKTSASGISLRVEDGTGQLTQNSFWLEGKATKAGPVEVDVDGQKVVVQAKAGETAAQVASKLSAALPRPYEANVNAAFPDGRAAIQIFRMETVPPALVKPVQDGKAPPVKVLITGYGKFANYATDDANPAWQLAQKAAQKAYPGAQVQAVLLPVEWDKVNAFAKTVRDTYQPDVIINLGAGPHGLEVWAQNATDGEDAAGQSHTGPADAAGPDFEQSTLPIQQIESAMKRVEDPSKDGSLLLHAPQQGTLDARLASAKQFQIDAQNTYLCNYLNYRMLEVTRGSGIMSGFIHVDETTSPQELETVITAAVRAKLEERASTPVS